MQMLSDDEDEEKAQNGDEALDFDDREMHNAMKNKRDFQVFIGSLPPNAQERELSDFFNEKKVKITNLRILRSTFWFIQMIRENRNVQDLAYASIDRASGEPWIWMGADLVLKVCASTWPQGNDINDYVLFAITMHTFRQIAIIFHRSIYMDSKIEQESTVQTQ